jgi:hypothetical protein
MPRYLLIRIDGENITTAHYDSPEAWKVGDTLSGELEGYEVVKEQAVELRDRLLIVEKKNT